MWDNIYSQIKFPIINGLNYTSIYPGTINQELPYLISVQEYDGSKLLIKNQNVYTNYNELFYFLGQEDIDKVIKINKHLKKYNVMLFYPVKDNHSETTFAISIGTFTKTKNLRKFLEILNNELKIAYYNPHKEYSKFLATS